MPDIFGAGADIFGGSGPVQNSRYSELREQLVLGRRLKACLLVLPLALEDNALYARRFPGSKPLAEGEKAALRRRMGALGRFVGGLATVATYAATPATFATPAAEAKQQQSARLWEHFLLTQTVVDSFKTLRLAWDNTRADETCATVRALLNFVDMHCEEALAAEAPAAEAEEEEDSI